MILFGEIRSENADMSNVNKYIKFITECHKVFDDREIRVELNGPKIIDESRKKKMNGVQNYMRQYFRN